MSVVPDFPCVGRGINTKEVRLNAAGFWVRNHLLKVFAAIGVDLQFHEQTTGNRRPTPP